MPENLKYPDRISEEHESKKDEGAAVGENSFDGGRDLEDKDPKKIIASTNVSNSEVIILI